MSLEIVINIYRQKLLVLKNENVLKEYDISSSEKGMGEIKNSFMTPGGKHIIRAKIGGHLPIYSVLVKRRPTGEIYNSALCKIYPDRDWILSRILWLSGVEVGKNRLGNRDSMNRYIYIHGTHAENNIGSPASKGCIRMKNKDIIELFDMVNVGTIVNIMAS